VWTLRRHVWTTPRCKRNWRLLAVGCRSCVGLFARRMTWPGCRPRIGSQSDQRPEAPCLLPGYPNQQTNTVGIRHHLPRSSVCRIGCTGASSRKASSGRPPRAQAPGSSSLGPLMERTKHSAPKILPAHFASGRRSSSIRFNPRRCALANVLDSIKLAPLGSSAARLHRRLGTRPP